MSSFARRIQRQVCPSQPVLQNADVLRDYPDAKPVIAPNPPRHKFYGKSLYHGGRGSRLGVTNPEDKARKAREARDKKWGRI